MLAVGNQPTWMPSVLSDPASALQTPARKPSSALALNAPRELALTPPDEQPPQSEFSLFGADGFSFADLIDVVNPLQHIPFVSTFYREATGDQIAPAPRVIGSSLFFGPLGFAGALANVMVEENTGKDIGQHMASWVTPASEQPEHPANGNPIAVTEQTTDTPEGPEDPVIAWARNEIDWARQGALKQGKAIRDATSPQDPTAETPIMPDAAPFLRQDPVPPPGPVDYVQAAKLSADLRSATWAYEAAANLRAPSPG
jgi:hypothetical protein